MNYKEEILSIFNDIKNKKYKTNIDIIAETIKKNSNFVCAFGISSLTNKIIDLFRERGLHFHYLSDNDSEKLLSDTSIYKTLKRIQASDLSTLPKDTAFIITCQFGSIIQHQLEGMGFSNVFWTNDLYYQTVEFVEDYTKNEVFIGQISKLFDYCSDEESKRVLYTILKLRVSAVKDGELYSDIYSSNQYFEKDIMQLSNKEVFIDCGAYDGDTVDIFIDRVNGCFEKIYAFEMDDINYAKMLKRFQGYPIAIQDKIVPLQMGVSDSKRKIRYSSKGVNSRIGDNVGDKTAVLDTIDSIVDDNEEVSLICMDIEGAEIEALNGARKTILQYKPKLAISIYHKMNDIWEIAEWIKNIVPEYKFYIRHHKKKSDDTVLYAIL